MEKEIKINSIKEKISQSGKRYFLADTSEGNMSVWDEDIAQDIQEFEGGILTVAFTINEKGFKTIRGVVGRESKKAKTQTTQTTQTTQNTSPQETKGDGKYTTMYVSYVKDLIVSGMKVEEAIDVVKAIRNEFASC